jgi:cytochrome oxidase Cu insertion factor (SCO1/SenC/PrrC family)
MIDQSTLTYEISKSNISNYSNNHYNTIYIMTSDYARKLATEDLTRRLQRQPFNTTILNELNKRATRISKCQIEGQKRLDKEKAKYFSKAIIGYKDTSYATEQEMLNGFSCTYEDLSPSEKSIYDRL